MAEADAADGWSDMDFEDDHIDDTQPEVETVPVPEPSLPSEKPNEAPPPQKPTLLPEDTQINGKSANGHKHEETQNEVAELQAQLSELRVQISEKDAQLEKLKNNAANLGQLSPADNAASEEQIKSLEEKLADAENERDSAKAQLEDFLSKISSMKTVVRNYKAAQAELDEVREQLSQAVGEKEAQATELATLKDDNEKKGAEITKLTKTLSQLKTESSDLNSECDRLSQELTILRRDLQLKDDAFQDEKYALENEVNKLMKRVNELKGAYNELELTKEEIAIENKNLQLIIEELKGKVDAKEAEVSEYTKIVKDMTTKLETAILELNSKIEAKTTELASLAQQLEKSQQETKKLAETDESHQAKIAKLEQENTQIGELKEEIHSKQLIIGKLRHEAIILNEHLTKSLSMLKQQLNTTDNTVDRELISNVFLNFLQIPRGDSKKFEALLLISALLEWDEPRKIQAGLSHSLSKGRDEEGRPVRQSFVSLWTDFLEKESSSKNAK